MKWAFGYSSRQLLSCQRTVRFASMGWSLPDAAICHLDWRRIGSDVPAGKFWTPSRAPASERQDLYAFHRVRRRGERIQGQTSDKLRNAALKIVSRGLEEILKLSDGQVNADFPPANQPDWARSILPAQTLSWASVWEHWRFDNAMAGYADFMISQWLTEFVLVPLKLVVLGRKRISKQGVFWKSVLAKTGQPASLDSVGLLPEERED